MNQTELAQHLVYVLDRMFEYTQVMANDKLEDLMTENDYDDVFLSRIEQAEFKRVVPLIELCHPNVAESISRLNDADTESLVVAIQQRSNYCSNVYWNSSNKTFEMYVKISRHGPDIKKIEEQIAPPTINFPPPLGTITFKETHQELEQKPQQQLKIFRFPTTDEIADNAKCVKQFPGTLGFFELDTKPESVFSITHGSIVQLKELFFLASKFDVGTLEDRVTGKMNEVPLICLAFIDSQLVSNAQTIPKMLRASNNTNQPANPVFSLFELYSIALNKLFEVY